MSESDRKKIAKDLETVQRQIYEVSEWPEEKLLDVDPEKVDWQKISLVNVSSQHSVMFHSSLPDGICSLSAHELRINSSYTSLNTCIQK